MLRDSEILKLIEERPYDRQLQQICNELLRFREGLAQQDMENERRLVAIQEKLEQFFQREIPISMLPQLVSMLCERSKPFPD